MEKSRNLPGDPKHHISGFKSHWLIYGILLILTVLTVLVSLVDLNLGIIPVVLALAIASAKAYVVIMYFMHVKFESKIVKVFILLTIVIFGIMIFFTILDYLTR